LRSWLALFFGIAVAGTAMSAASAGSAPTSNAPTGRQVYPQVQAVAALQMTEIGWHKSGFNNIMMLKATVQNSGKRDVKDIKVVCDHSSDSQTKIDSNSATIYGPFPVHATLTTNPWGRAAR